MELGLRIKILNQIPVLQTWDVELWAFTRQAESNERHIAFKA